ncbi:uncharacterized protein LAESUDRAFT_662005 [Laetiporus sulphureus 93-53]|uniref:Uncharacterized protein n=1 Tax=Laetiporus sulphureus 93-53 TaxID=1314785 RepID=A0A165C8K4_9APHY|nr:uncharacterized protein LAESUDRAFT_662005 [Laetiporus sulphureus 93-53]KZT02391.1 hypothetical protein LAESUDRAFT_662005 [Laetiporus sulphureus 93-53]
MDPSSHHQDPSQQAQVSSASTSSRKRSRENETPSQRHKREKAAERQRRKRERDRQAGLNNILALSQVQQAGQQPIEAPAALPPTMDFSKGDDASVEEVAKRERVRAAARERQRKHRALVKARKMRELGMDMGNEIMPGMEDVQYRMSADGQYQPVMPHEMQPHPPPHPHVMHEPPFPQGPPLGGQTFASTLLLSFSCAPLLKQHLLRSLNMTNEELASLEPIIAQAWDHWDQQRRMHYAHHAANGHKAPDGSAVQDPNAAPYPPGMNYVHDPSQAAPNDFRARFHRPLVAPSPFRSSLVGTDPQQGGQSISASTSTGAPGTSSDGMDPAVTMSATSNTGEPRPALLSAVTGIDPQLGQARDEAAGVAGKLERS